MKTVLIVIFVAFITVSAANFHNNEVQIKHRLTALELNREDAIFKKRISNKIPIQGRKAILSENGKLMVENFINHLPCGWPDAGIPPLAPYAKKEIDFKLKKSFVELSQKFEYFRIDGLDIMLIERLKVGYMFKKYVKFNLTYPKIIISGKYFTDLFIDLLKKYGVSLRYDGESQFELMLENMNFRGSFKYDMPILFGHTEIYNFDISVTLGNVVSKIGGIGGNGKLNRLLNDKIEEIAVHLVNTNQYDISMELEKVLVPFINEKLEGRNLWTFFKSLFGQKGKICYPPPYPW
ncbi:uncharacterized protein LOC129940321 isoform X2 [Eupeodes corollae]|uniref:uncharacterized protein LOC129940321 isoform X2 n=1 Tax=Eupeodes corollae TaxID=290404 RepID=UPI002492BF2F|nr:uncharacterized protein LOC129940321 isoform X2 [Eupeodes corollae]